MPKPEWLLSSLVFSACMAHAADWKLVWSDDFDAAGLPDPAKWGYEVGQVRNGEAQYYTKARKENARLEDGMLVIESRKESFSGAGYTSASLHTNGLKSWTYGRIEVRAKLPKGRGIWPAIWTLGVSGGWPAGGEIDIMEYVGFDPDRIHFNIHTSAVHKGTSAVVSAPYSDFHVYAVEWFKDRLDFYVDSVKYFTYMNPGNGSSSWPYDRPQYLLLNTAIGGGWGGQQGIDDGIFPQKFLIDYVRVFAESPEPASLAYIWRSKSLSFKDGAAPLDLNGRTLPSISRSSTAKGIPITPHRALEAGSR